MMGMPHVRGRWAFTLIEMLTVVAIIVLLMAMLLPSLSGAREQGRRAYCLANLRSIGQAAVAYAGEDKRELLIPIHQSMTTPFAADDYWLRRTAMWFSFGGPSPLKPFVTDDGPRDLATDPRWSAESRPLNRLLFNGVSAATNAPEQKVFRCPSDRGYPDHPDIDDSPRANADRTCFETLGNSYRASLYGIFPLRGEPYDGAFSVGPWGHRLSSIPEPARVAAFGEPAFFNMIGRDDVGGPNPDPVLTIGWHRRRMIDNLVFVDGSARSTLASGHQTVDPEVAQGKMMVGPNWDLISRGPGWRFDLWPTPGARVFAIDPTNQMWNPGYTAQPGDRENYWPFVNAEDNLRPEP